MFYNTFVNSTTARLAKSITKSSSLQTYYIIKLLVDRGMNIDAYKAYAYFRWLDDQVDKYFPVYKERIQFIQRQKHIVDNAYARLPLPELLLEEKIIAELIETDTTPNSRLNSFITNFMSIIVFDARRKGKTISEKELYWYSDTLGKAVTDCILHFIGHNSRYPSSNYQYTAAASAHIIHMLRDHREDIPEGYYNIPKEFLEKNKIKPDQIQLPVYKTWVKKRVSEARNGFSSGKQYIDQIPVLRCKIAAHLYCARFEWLLAAIEKDGYLLREKYIQPHKTMHALHLLQIALSLSIRYFIRS